MNKEFCCINLYALSAQIAAGSDIRIECPLVTAARPVARRGSCDGAYDKDLCNKTVIPGFLNLKAQSPLQCREFSLAVPRSRLVARSSSQAITPWDTHWQTCNR